MKGDHTQLPAAISLILEMQKISHTTARGKKKLGKKETQIKKMIHFSSYPCNTRLQCLHESDVTLPHAFDFDNGCYEFNLFPVHPLGT